MFEKTFIAGWGETDFNAHLRNSAFLDMCSDVRMLYFEANGFSVDDFSARAIGPVVMHDELTYRAEIRLLEQVRVTLELAGLADDGSRFRFRNEFRRSDDALAVRVISTGGWLDLQRRKLVVPPTELLDALRALGRTDDFSVLSSSARS